MAPWKTGTPMEMAGLKPDPPDPHVPFALALVIDRNRLLALFLPWKGRITRLPPNLTSLYSFVNMMLFKS